jgi:type II secretion system protein G
MRQEVTQEMAFRRHLTGQKGFTLIELLVVVAILGILAAVAVPRVMGAIDNARERKALADLTVIRNALERFYLEYGVFPTDLAQLIDQGDFGPDFDFTNSYGNCYFYAVRWEVDASGTPTANALKDYILADPGQNPPAFADWVAGGLTGDKSCEGLDPRRENTHEAYFWGYDPGAGVTSVAVDYTAVNISNQPWRMQATLYYIQVDKPSGNWIVYTGQ